ncbi:MAG: hypothetical protein AAF460_13945, partial [Pseudomonadota bacterium]
MPTLRSPPHTVGACYHRPCRRTRPWPCVAHALDGLRAALNRGLPVLGGGGVAGLAGPAVVTVGVER